MQDYVCICMNFVYLMLQYEALNIPYPEDKRSNTITEKEKEVVSRTDLPFALSLHEFLLQDKKCEELVKEAKERAASLQQKV